MKVLQIGPSIEKSKGGMSAVIGEIQNDSRLQEQVEIDTFSSYIDGGKLQVLLYSACSFLKFIIRGEASKYDIYHIHLASYGSTYRKMAYARILKAHHKKVILHIHGGGYMEFYNGLAPRNKNKVLNFLKLADLVIALSEDWKQKFESVFHLNNCVVLKNGVDTEKLSPAITDPALHQNAFLALSRMNKGKGIYDLLDAAVIAREKVPDLKIFLAGDGEIEEVRKAIAKKKLENIVQVVGWVDFNQKVELLKQVTTVVLPSYNEALPMCILEGMACGKAIISTTVGAIPEVVKEENGILIEAGDVNALADAMMRCSSDREMIHNMSVNNIEKINSAFSLQDMHTKLKELYERIEK